MAYYSPEQSRLERDRYGITGDIHQIHPEAHNYTDPDVPQSC